MIALVEKKWQEALLVIHRPHSHQLSAEDLYLICGTCQAMAKGKLGIKLCIAGLRGNLPPLLGCFPRLISHLHSKSPSRTCTLHYAEQLIFRSLNFPDPFCHRRIHTS